MASEITLTLLEQDYLFHRAVRKLYIQDFITFKKFFSKQVIFIFWKGKTMLCFVAIALMLGKTKFHHVIAPCTN